MDNDKFGDYNNSHNNISPNKSKNREQNEVIRTSLSSSESVKVKKSTNLLSAFVKRRRNKARVKKTSGLTTLTTVKEPSPDASFIASSTTLGMRSEEESIMHVENYEEYDTTEKNNTVPHKLPRKISNYSGSEPSIAKANSRASFFRKLIKKPGTLNNDNKCSGKSVHIGSSQTEACHIGDSSPSSDTSEDNKISSEELNKIVPTCYTNCGKPTLNVTLVNGLQLVQELASRLLKSENHFIQIFSRYISDPACQKELFSTLNQHSKLQWETERRTNALANDMWLHQIEVGRAQERTLQETLNSLVKQNRQLQIDNEMLFRRNERLINKMQSYNDTGLRHRCVDCDNRFELVVKRNEKLQYKLEAFCQQIQHLENELHILQKHNEGLEQQLRSSSHQIHNIKAIYQRSKMDYELEIVALNHKIMQNECTIKDAMEAGNVLFQDLDSIKIQIQNLAIPMNLSNFKLHGGGLMDLVHLCRSYINEMAKEFIGMFTQVRLQEKDIQNLEEANNKLQENLEKSKSEITALNKMMEANSVKETEKIILEQKCKLLETDAHILKEQMCHQKEKYELEVKTLVEKLENLEHANKAVSEKDKMIDQTKIFVNNITSENVALRSQVDCLNNALSESGAGDVLQELSHIQEQLAFFQTQYYQLLNEKQVLLEQIDLLRTDNKTILELQESSCKNFQQQLQDLELLGKETNSLKQQLEAEHQTVLSLQAERVKHLEEKSMLKSIFQHMKTEIARVQKLEGTVTDISKEANKLAMIAEYNKSLGEKLKSEIVDREKTILQLRTSVEKLNEVQIKNTKEKLALCYELSELSQEKEKLNNILSIEVKKNMVLDDSKKEIAKTATSQLRKFEEIQKTERSALTDLVKDFKALCAQREELQGEKDKLQLEVAELKAMNNGQMQRVDSLMFAKNEAEFKLKDALSKIEEHRSTITSLNDKLTAEVKKYHNNVKQLEKLILQLRIDKEKLDDGIKYLQNNTEKLHKDLNEARKNEKETSNKLNKVSLEKELLDREKQDLIAAYNEEKEKLQAEIRNVNSICEKILADYESAMKASTEKEEFFKHELDESKKLLLSNAKEIDHLNEVLCIRQEEIIAMSEDYHQIKEKEKRCDAALKTVEEYKSEYEDLIDRKFRLEKDICNLQANYRNTKEALEKSQIEVENLQEKLAKAVEEKEKQCSTHKRQIEELARKHAEVVEKNNAQIKELKVQTNDLVQQLHNERSAYASLSQIHKEISAKFIKGIKDLVDEKNGKQEAISKLKEINECVSSLQADKEDLQQQVNVLLDSLNDGKNRINLLSQEKETNTAAFEDLQKRYNELLQKCISLESRVREPNWNNEELETTKDQLEKLRKQLDDNNNKVLSLQREITNLQQQITALEFQKSEATLRFHETQRKLQTEENMCELLKNTHKALLNSILKLKEEGRMDPVDCNHIVHLVQSNSTNSESAKSNK